MRGAWWQVASQVGADRRSLVAPAALLVASAGLPLVGPQIIRAFVDDAIARRPLSTLAGLAVAFLVVMALSEVANVVTTYLCSGVAWRATNSLREKVAAHALGLDMSFHNRHTPGEMIERVDGDMLGLGEFISDFVGPAIRGLVLLIGAIVLVWLANPWAGLSLTALVVFGGGSLLEVQRRTVPLAERFRQATADMFGGAEERLLAVEDIRANGAGRHAVRRFHEDAAAVWRADKRWQVRGGGALAGTNFLFGFGTALIVGVGIVLLHRHEVSLGTVVLLLQYSSLVRQPVDQILGNAKLLHQAGAATTRIAELLAERPSIVEVAHPRHLPAGALGVRFEQVTFAYPGGDAVLHTVDLEVPPGRSLGLVGRTGSGKSTLGRLAMRLYDTTDGAVRIGGIDVRDLALNDLRRTVRVVTQEVFLFAASLRDNLTLWDDSVTDEAIDAALVEVGLGDWSAALDAGLDTVVAPGGVELSGGEAQLLSFARVLLADPAVVILDEPSSRLDSAAEEVVHAATDRLLAGRTAIVIAHRLSTLTTVDDIAVIDGGSIVEHGPRAALAADGDSAFSRLLAGRR